MLRALGLPTLSVTPLRLLTSIRTKNITDLSTLIEMFTILWDVKEPTHLSQMVGHVVPGVVVCLLWYYYRGPCVRKLFTGLNMYYPLKIKNIVLYCIVFHLVRDYRALLNESCSLTLVHTSIISIY